MKGLLKVMIVCFLLSIGYQYVEKAVFEYQLSQINQAEVGRCSKDMQLNPDLICD